MRHVYEVGFGSAILARNLKPLPICVIGLAFAAKYGIEFSSRIDGEEADRQTRVSAGSWKSPVGQRMAVWNRMDTLDPPGCEPLSNSRPS